jgi:succinoglycan biosynthesis protein ExoA
LALGTRHLTRHPTLPTVTIIVACRNEASHVDALIAGIGAQTYPRDKLELVVADGESTDGTREQILAAVARDNLVRLVTNPARTTAAGLNKAIESATGEVLVRMDAHTEYAPDYVERCVETLILTGAANVGGPARTRASGYVQRSIAAAYNSWLSVGGAAFHLEHIEGPVDTVPYGCWWRRVFDEVGLFDESLTRNQDDEHNLRIIRHGLIVWQSASIRSWYRPRSSLKNLFGQYFQYGYWKVAVMRKHRRIPSWRHVAPTIAIGALLASVVVAVADPRLAWCPALLVAGYAAAVAVQSIGVARDDLRMVFLLPVVYACFHFGYGLGFAAGLCDWLRGKYGQRQSVQRLTRGEAE